MTDKPQARLPRFKRDPERTGAFQVTQRDIEILRHVAEHRFIRSEWIIKLVGGSKQQLIRRLNLLFHHGYLDRPRCQLDYYHEGGSKSLVYGLASRGAGRLRRDLDMPFERMDWTTRNKGVGRLFLEHTLMVSDFMAALEIDCQNCPDVRLLYAHDLPKPKGRENSREPFRWSVDLPGKRRIKVVPDKVFALEVTHPGGHIERTHYFLEADRSTMPLERRNPHLSCVMRKFQAYEMIQLKNSINKIGCLRPFKVIFLTVCTTRSSAIRSLLHRRHRFGTLVFSSVPKSGLQSAISGQSYQASDFDGDIS